MTTGLPDAGAYRRWTWLCVLLIAAGCIVGIIVPAGPGWDFANFYDAGRRVAAGESINLYAPATPIAGEAPQGKTGFYGTPLSALFYLPMAGFSASTALVLFKIQNVAALGLALFILFRFYRAFAARDGIPPAQFAAWFAFLCLLYQPFWTIFRVGGQTTPSALLLLIAALVFHTGGRWWPSAISVVLAVLIKPGLAYVLVFLACVAGLAFLWRLVAVLAIAGAASLLTFGWTVHESFLTLMRQSTQFTWAWYFNSSLYVPIDNVRLYFGATGGALGFVLSAATAALKGAVIALLVVRVFQSRRAGLEGIARRHFDFTLAILFFLLWSPTIWEHYLQFLFPFLIYLVASRLRYPRSVTSAALAISVLSVFQNLILINWLRDHVTFASLPALVAIGVVKSAPLLLTFWLLWQHGGALVRNHAPASWSQRLSTESRTKA